MGVEDEETDSETEVDESATQILTIPLLEENAKIFSIFLTCKKYILPDANGNAIYPNTGVIAMLLEENVPHPDIPNKQAGLDDLDILHTAFVSALYNQPTT